MLISKAEILINFLFIFGLFDYSKSIAGGGKKLKSIMGTRKACVDDGMVALTFDDGA